MNTVNYHYESYNAFFRHNLGVYAGYFFTYFAFMLGGMAAAYLTFIK